MLKLCTPNTILFIVEYHKMSVSDKIQEAKSCSLVLFIHFLLYINLKLFENNKS